MDLRTSRCAQSRGLKTPLSKQLVGVEIVAPCDVGKRGASLEALVDNPALLFQRPGPPLAPECRRFFIAVRYLRWCPLLLEMDTIFTPRAQRQAAAAGRRRSPWENGFIESFNARLRDELLDGEIFYSLAEAKIVIESWRRHYNTERPHGSLGYKPPAPEVFVPAMAARAAAQTRPATPPALASRPSMH